MTKLEQIIQAIKTLHFNALDVLLDDDKSYMEVPKSVFLDKLREEFSRDMESGFTGFDKVLNCNCCEPNKGCTAFTFSSEDHRTINLFFQVENEEVLDIYLCRYHILFKEPKRLIIFKFYEEDKIGFRPDMEYHLYKQKTEKAVDDFNRLVANKLIYVQDIIDWYDKHKDTAEKYKYNSIFYPERYNGFLEFEEILRNTKYFIQIAKKNSIAKAALFAYTTISTEKELVKWLLKYREDASFADFLVTENWEKTGFIMLDYTSGIAVDCHDYIDAFIFDSTFSNDEFRILEKYSPTKEHYKKHPDGISCDLKTFLKLHNMYLDILPEK
jgi:hypothetical protein